MVEGWGNISITVFQDGTLDWVKTKNSPRLPVMQGLRSGQVGHSNLQKTSDPARCTGRARPEGAVVLPGGTWPLRWSGTNKCMKFVPCNLRTTHLIGCVLFFTQFFKSLHELCLDDAVLFLGVPLWDLREAFFLEMIFQCISVAFVWREKCEKIFDTALFERARKMVHGLVDKIGAENERQDAYRDICRE